MKPILILILLVFLAGCKASPGTIVQPEPASPVSAAPASSGAVPTQTPGETLVPATSARTPEAAVSGFAPLAVTQAGVNQLHLIDLSAGLDAAGRAPISLPAGAEISKSVTSADQNHLALVSGEGLSCQPYAGGSTCFPAADRLHLVDTAIWQAQEAPLSGQGSVSHLVFHPDGSRLALTYNTASQSSLLVFDAASGEQTAQLVLDFQPEWLAFVLDGKALAVYGVPRSADPGLTQPPAPRLQLLDPTSLQPRRDMRFDSLLSGEWCLEGCTGSPDQRHFIRWKPGLALSPDGSHLYIIHADQEILSSIDLAKGDRQENPIETAASWLERLLSRTAQVTLAKGLAEGAIRNAAISADGARLYVLTERYTQDPPASQSGQRLQVIELPEGPAAVQPGIVLASANLNPDRPMHALLPASGGEQLLLLGYAGNKPLLQVVSAADLEPSASLIGWEVSPGPGVFLGRRTTPAGSELAVIDPGTLEVLKSWQVEGDAAWLPGL